jgi:hypothetical protein
MRICFAVAAVVAVITAASAQAPRGALSGVPTPPQDPKTAAPASLLPKDVNQDASIENLQQQVNELRQLITQLQNQPKSPTGALVSLTPDDQFPTKPPQEKKDDYGELSASVRNLWDAITVVRADMKKMNQR